MLFATPVSSWNLPHHLGHDLLAFTPISMNNKTLILKHSYYNQPCLPSLVTFVSFVLLSRQESRRKISSSLVNTYILMLLSTPLSIPLSLWQYSMSIFLRMLFVEVFINNVNQWVLLMPLVFPTMVYLAIYSSSFQKYILLSIIYLRIHLCTFKDMFTLSFSIISKSSLSWISILHHWLPTSDPWI